MALRVNGIGFTFGGKPFDMWGLRVASAVYSDDDTVALISALDEYRSYGINTITVFYQGSSGGYCQAFAPDGGSIDRNIQRRIDEIIDAAAQRDMVVVVGLFYQRSDRLESADAYLRAAEYAARSLAGRANVAINVANEQSSVKWKGCPFPMREPDGIGRLCEAAKQGDPECIVGGGGFHTENNLQLARDPRVDVLWYDDQEYIETFHRYQAQGLEKPHVNVEVFGLWAGGCVSLADGTLVQGVWPENDPGKGKGKEDFREAIRFAAEHEGLYLFGHLQAWFQGRSRGLGNRYDVAGVGTVDDPGIRWYLEEVKKARDSRPTQSNH